MKQLTLKKSVARIQAESGRSELQRTMGKWNLLSMGIGCIIGAGIFVMTGHAAAEYAGPAIMLSFVLAGLCCAFAGLCYAELASVLPVSGSAYTYSYATLGEGFAWIMGWLLLLEYGVAAATVAVGLSGYIVSFLGNLDMVIPASLTTPTLSVDHASGAVIFNSSLNLPAMGAVLALTALLMRGVKESVTINNVIVAVKLVVIVLFILVGMWYINVENWQPFIPEPTGKPGQYGVEGILRGAGIVFFAYVGFEAVSTAAQEAKNPQKDMPFGILGSLLVCTILYMGVSAVLTGVVPYTMLSVPDPMSVAVDAIGHGWFSMLIKIGAIAGLTSVTMVLLYGQTRIFYTMSRDGLIPPVFSAVHPRLKTPWMNTMIVGVVVAFLAGVTPIDILGDLVSLGTLCAFGIICLSVLYLRKTEPKLERPFRVPLCPYFPIFGMVLCAYLVWGLLSNPVTIQFYMIYLALGAAFYAWYGRKHSKLRQGIDA